MSEPRERRDLRPCPVLPHAVRVLRLQRVRGARRPEAAVPAGVAGRGVARRARVGGQRVRAASSSAGARRRRCAPADLGAARAPARLGSTSPTEPRSRSRRTPTRWTSRRSRRFATAGYDRLSMGRSRSTRRCSRRSSGSTSRSRSRAAFARGPRGRLRQRQPRPHLRRRRARRPSRGSARSARRSRSRPSTCRAYALTIEPATPLGRQVAAGDAPAPDPDLQAEMFVAGVRAARATRATATTRSRTGPSRASSAATTSGTGNGGPYVGLGAGAHAYRDDVRWWNVRPPEEYMALVEAGELPDRRRASRSTRPTPTSRRCS